MELRLENWSRMSSMYLLAIFLTFLLITPSYLLMILLVHRGVDRRRWGREAEESRHLRNPQTAVKVRLPLYISSFSSLD
jgi:hypothetical protein